MKFEKHCKIKILLTALNALNEADNQLIEFGTQYFSVHRDQASEFWHAKKNHPLQKMLMDASEKEGE